MRKDGSMLLNKKGKRSLKTSFQNGAAKARPPHDKILNNFSPNQDFMKKSTKNEKNSSTAR